MDICKMYINGEWCESSAGKVRKVTNPSDGNIAGIAAEGSVQDLDRAVEAAEAALESWKKTSTAERAALMLKAADLVDQRIEEIAKAESRANGELLRVCEMDAGTVSAMLRFYAGIIDLPAGSSYNGDPMVTTVTLKEPIGVCGIIVPWNAPIDIASKAIAPALAAGNTVVLKPSSQTPFATALVVECLHEAGFPPGTVNLVLGSGETIGQAMAEHPKINKLNLTGGTETGRDIIRASASNIKKLSLELGGKSAICIFDDADLEAAVENAMYILYSSAGQLCVAGSRLLVQDTVYDRVLEILAEKAPKINVGAADDPEAEMGPVITERQRDRILEYIEIGKQEGARLLTGGKALTGGIFDKGFYIEPTVFADVKNDMRIAQEEIFGPVLVVERFNSEEEAFRMANDSIYGLGAGIYTNDTARGWRFAKEVKAACMWINTYGPSAGFGAPISCVKQSGYSTLMGLACLESYMDTKMVNFMSVDAFQFGWFSQW